MAASSGAGGVGGGGTELVGGAGGAAEERCRRLTRAVRPKPARSPPKVARSRSNSCLSFHSIS
jgi:hypothetical protein